MGWQKFLHKAIMWGSRKSPWLIHFNSGICNGCAVEAIAAITPRFDLERLGALQQSTPRQADVLICSGVVTLKTRERLQQIYNQMSEPKFVVAVGTCACSGGVFAGCYGVVGGIDTVIPVDAYLPGCAARPEVLIDTLDKLLATWEEEQKQALAAPPLAEPQNVATNADNATATVGADGNQPGAKITKPAPTAEPAAANQEVTP